MLACIGLVLGFRSSSSLAAAYGVAVTTDMVFTTILFAVVARSRWKWGLPAVIALATTFLVVDLGFWGASLLKIPSGGWFPLDRKSTRLNSSHSQISYAVFCLKKK